MSMKYPNDPTRKRTRDLPARSAAPQPAAPPGNANIKAGGLEIKLWEGGQCLDRMQLVQGRNQVQEFVKLVLKSLRFEVSTAYSCGIGCSRTCHRVNALADPNIST